MATVTKAADASASGTASWVNPSNAFATTGDNVYATLASIKNGNRTAYMLFPDFTSADIPDGSTINSVTLFFEWGMSATVTGGTILIRADGDTAQLSKSTVAEQAQSLAWDTPPSLAALRTAGTDGTSGVVFAIFEVTKGSTNTAMNLNLDYCYIVVDYTAPVPNPVPRRPKQLHRFLTLR